jgi:2-succinyl-5-enolpyruvyl-6-hydroxy-3-cyclohexene-1-carboxylate synthase
MAFARHGGFRVYMHIDERSGSFFGLGLAKATGLPVALLCTSGTAAAEFHPAVVEAAQSHTPLVVLTADRPAELRDTGANQAVDQLRLYGAAPRWFFELGVPDENAQSTRFWRRLGARAVAEAAGPPSGPVHLNLAFRDPLTPAAGQKPEARSAPAFRLMRDLAQPTPETTRVLTDALLHSRRPVIVAGSLPEGAALRPALSTLGRAGVVILAEPTSQLRIAGMPGLVADYDALLRDGPWAAQQRPDLVLRLGAAPTSKPLNQWLSAIPPDQVLLVDPQRSWMDPDQAATAVFQCDPLPLLEALAGAVPARDPGWQQEWTAAAAAASRALDSALHSSRLHEGHVVRALAEAAPAAATVVLGSSMAVRDADTFWPAASGGQRFLANRGASGIDGLVSTAFGAAAGSQDHTIALMGDLSLYHDMNGLWAARRHGLRVTLVVLDNDGGGIFSYLPPAEHEDVFEELFATPLGLRLEGVAELYQLDFFEARRCSELAGALRSALDRPGSSLLAVRFSRSDSVAGHRAAWAAVSSVLRSPGRPAAP